MTFEHEFEKWKTKHRDTCLMLGTFAETFARHFWDARGDVTAWIPVSERLPETTETVLIARPSGAVEPAWYSPFENHKAAKWRHLDGTPFGNGTITHWQPLPSSPDKTVATQNTEQEVKRK